MINLVDYQIRAQIYESANSEVYRAFRESDREPVILKVLKQDYPTPSELTRYKQEYELTRSLNLEGIIKVYSLEKYQNTLVIILEDFGGESLKKLSKNTQFSLKEFIPIAIKIAMVLGEIHNANVIHKDINSGNIVFNPETQQLKIIDFGISSKLSRENPILKNPNVLEGTLAYISPEQTGRMNRSLDYRTDFYSLGVTFYELLTGKLPFTTQDDLELVHCHLAKKPLLPSQINPSIPPIISAIVMKLMAKNAEDRYQSAWGLKADLETCLNQLETKVKIEKFPLGSQDISDKFQIPQKLYGREAEIKALIEGLERGTLQSELMLVAGYSGIGKSALVQEIYKPITEKRGYFTSGKFDQFQRNTPYSAVADAFKGLVKQLLTETEAELKQWRAKISKAVGVNGRVIIDLIPEVELIIGKQAPVPELGPNEYQNRFNLVFSQFLKVFCQREHPLVIFLDDLQWADLATLKLIELIMTDAELQYLFVIGAYRDNEVNPSHSFIITLEYLRSQGVIINEIALQPLTLDNISQLIAETFQTDTESVVDLATTILNKTGGNPFFVNEFLTNLYSENLVYFDVGSQSWHWNIEEIEGQNITDNVVDLTVGNLKKMPESQQQVLSMAACVGAEFNLNTLEIICEKSAAETFKDLEAAVQSGFIIAISELDHRLLIENYKFRHDSIQQAAYSLIDETEKKQIHLKIGRLLLENSNSPNLGERIFEIIDHLNQGIELVTNLRERKEIARLNLIAAQKAKAATAYYAAAKYLKIGRELLIEKSWRIEYTLRMALYVEAIEVAFINGEFEEQEELSKVVMEKGRSLLEKIEVYEFQILAYQSNNQPLQAIETALEVLKLLDVTFPESPTYSDIKVAWGEIKSKLKNERVLELIDMSPMTYPYKLAIMRILSRIISTAFQAAPLLLPLIICKMVDLSLEYGNAEESTYAYSMYGAITIGIFLNIDLGYKFGELALNLVSKMNAKSFKAKTIFGVNLFIKPWKEAIAATFQPLLSAYQIGLETGDTEYAAMSPYIYCSHKYLSGQELGKLKEELLIYRKVIAQLKQKTYLNHHSIYCQVVSNLTVENKNPSLLLGKIYDESQMLPLHLQGKDRNALGIFYINKTILCYLFENYTEALKNASKSQKYLRSLSGFFLVATFYFYESLAHLATDACHKLSLVDKNQEKMKMWAENASCNCQHKYDLVAAETARVLGQNWEAIKLYDRAIKGAKENGYLQEEALAYELAAKFYWTEGMDKFAETYIKEAHYAYTRWGATAKVKRLEAKYPLLLNLTPTNKAVPSTTTTRISTGNSDISLDMATVIKANQAISGEIVLDKLLVSLMKIVIENAGAEIGYLILANRERLVVELSGVIDSEQVGIWKSVPLENCDCISQAVVNYVARTKESVVLNDAAKEGNFTNDAYIKEHKPKSVLCVPFINQGRLVSIVYLENNLTTGAFTAERVKILNLLSSQAAISIENAKLYAKVRDNESRLAQFLEAMPVGVAIFESNGQMNYINQKAKEIIGKGVASDATEEQLAEVYQVYTADTTEPYPVEKMPGVRALRGEVSTVDDMEIHQPDKIVPIEVWGTPIYDENGEVAYGIAAFQDITERKKAEEEKQKFTSELFQLNVAYERFVPRQFLQFLEKATIIEVELGDQVQLEMSVLFSDIRDFTTLSEQMNPEDNFKFINAYLSRMESPIVENKGFIDKYIGDAIMALFGGDADNAIKGGIGMLEQLKIYNQKRIDSGYVSINIGIGINTGNLMLGTVATGWIVR